jgi:hypothetical protein
MPRKATRKPKPKPKPKVAGPFMLPAEKFPFTMIAVGRESGRELWETTVMAPPALTSIRIPPLARMHGEPVDVHILFADGTTEEP